MAREKIYSLEKLKEELFQLKGKGKKIVFTNGCFDVLHFGHVCLLEKAKEFGDILVVALNSDSSIRKIKGSRRPIVPQEERLRIIAALEVVDYVLLFSDIVPLTLIQELKPHVLVKGGDWVAEEIIGAREVESWGGEVKIVPLIEGLSTTKIIERILQAYGRGDSFIDGQNPEQFL